MDFATLTFQSIEGYSSWLILLGLLIGAACYFGIAYTRHKNLIRAQALAASRHSERIREEAEQLRQASTRKVHSLRFPGCNSVRESLSFLKTYLPAHIVGHVQSAISYEGTREAMDPALEACLQVCAKKGTARGQEILKFIDNKIPLPENKKAYLILTVEPATETEEEQLTIWCFIH